MNSVYDIHLCRKNEVEDLTQFIDRNWKKNHILTVNRRLLNWQHLDEDKKVYNYLIARNKKTEKIDGIIGFIPTSQFDKDLRVENDIWLAIWTVDRKSIVEEGLGIKLLYSIHSMHPNSIGAIGITPYVRKIYKAFKYSYATMKQYYYLNKKINEYKLIKMKKQIKINTHRESRNSFQINEIDLKDIENLTYPFRPKKTLRYLENRYAKHPIYNYHFLGIYDVNKLVSVFIVRMSEAVGKKCIRVVDIFGDFQKLYNLSKELDKILEVNEAEYIDIYNYGIDQNVFYNMGFLLRTDDIIIPNYFEPFVNRNIDIMISFKSNYKDYIVFKADSDQDRPNQL